MPDNATARATTITWLTTALFAFACGVGGCNVAHTMPTTGTETGNPILHEELVVLVVTKGDVHIVGKPGAVSPGGCGVHVDDTASSESFDGSSSSNGTFDVQVDGTRDDTYVVTAVCGMKSSAAVYVLRGKALVVGSQTKLSCEQQGDVARAQIDQAVAHADRKCRSTNDCVETARGSVCSDACYPEIVSTQGAAVIETAIEGVANGVCRTFAADGCFSIALPCVPQPKHMVVCKDGVCGSGADSDGGFDGGSQPVPDAGSRN